MRSAQFQSLLGILNEHVSCEPQSRRTRHQQLFVREQQKNIYRCPQKLLRLRERQSGEEKKQAYLIHSNEIPPYAVCMYVMLRCDATLVSVTCKGVHVQESVHLNGFFLFFICSCSFPLPCYFFAFACIKTFSNLCDAKQEASVGKTTAPLFTLVFFSFLSLPVNFVSK